MRYYGDIPKEHLELIKELQYLEDLITRHVQDFPPLALSKGFVCTAHDYFSIYFDEEGERLLKLADKHCPGYFAGPIYVHAQKDSEYYKLVDGLRHTLALKTMTSLGFSNESL